ncbi:uncharacterized protein LOC133297925 [Gastrolobium bilobum]|uniref:uncharacterized protein LOC133297925 n=1 Tax=Gastrolobium bilobum TaxID=150636 RepID=UPI002AB18851|nr:uncharacterized protein LOC133297925 [Gastrolobium bilobum]
MATPTDTDWSSQTNWTVASGSLRNCLTFESSLSSFDDEASTSESSPLILHPPSPDSAPCEIKINFAEKHELRQVYVRSTARVYEIYSALDLQSNDDYLCTVRCGVAARDGEVLRPPNIQEIDSLTNKDYGDDNVKNEDDWVEVKVVDTPVQTKPYIDSTKTTQDLYEATAEVNDANPCISVTLRLLSLQNKGCVCVDEIYVFGDPVDSADLESQESRNENSSGSSLMAMFLPTIMQLSKTTGLGHLNAVRKEKQYVLEDDKEETHLSDSVVKTQLKGKDSITDPQEVSLKEVKGGWARPSQVDALSQVAKVESEHAAVPSQAAKIESNCSVVPSKIAETENNHGSVPVRIAETECYNSAVPSQVAITESNHGDSLGGNVERALGQLLSRMDRIEEICLGFQEKMVMPMNSIEARLQRVEQQLDTLTKKVQNSALPSCSRISAPDASCIESDANSSDNCLDHAFSEQQLDTLTNKVQNSALPSCSRISAPDASCIESDANSSDNCLDHAFSEQQLDTLTNKVLNSALPSCSRISAPDASCIESDANSSDNCLDHAVSEQQLDTLTKKVQNSALPSCSRISAPDASCIESDANSSDNCLDHAVAGEVESDEKCLHTEVLHVSPHDVSDSSDTTQLLSGLVVSAPQFPDGEDEEDNASGQEMNSSNDKGKQSIDDALSSALANFLSSLESPEYTKILTVKAPDFSNENDEDHESNNEIVKIDSDHLMDSEKINHIQVLALSDISLESGEEVNRDCNDKHSEETAQEAEEYDQFRIAEGDQDQVCAEVSILDEHNPGTGFNNNDEEDENGKINGQKSDGLLSNVSEISNELLDNQTPDGYSITQEGPSTRTDLTVATEVPEKASVENIIENVLGFSLASSVVDFEIPLLDVKFNSQRSPVGEHFLEALLGETPETSSRDPSVKESSDDLPVKEQLKSIDDLSFEEQRLQHLRNPASVKEKSLIEVDNGEPENPASDSHSAVDKDYCTSITVPVNIEGDNQPLPGDHKRKRDQISTPCLI